MDFKETTFENYLDEQLKNDDFKAEWEALEPEYANVQTLIEAGTSAGVAQSELASGNDIDQGES